MRAPRVNPVLRRELLERWRSRRAAITLTVYLTALGGILYVLYRIGLAVLGFQVGIAMGGGDASLAGPALGRFLFESLLFFVLLLVLFVAPGYAAAQLSGERERRTLPLLQVTLLSPAQIVLGKLGAAVAWLALLVVATLPLGAAAFFLGGVGVGDLLRGIAYVLVVAVAVAAMAIGASALTRRTTGAIVLTYGLVLALVAGSLLLALADVVVRQSGGGPLRTPVALYANPVFGLSDAVRAVPASDRFVLGFSGFDLPSPLSLMAEALPRGDRAAPDAGPQPLVRVEPALEEPAGEPFAEAPLAGGAAGRRPVWLQVMGLYVGAGSAGLLLAHRRLGAGLRGPGRLRRRRRVASARGGP